MPKFLLFLILLIFPFFVWADNSGNSNGYAWFEKIGWIHFSGEDAGVDYGIKISSDQITGYVWSEKTGWISLSCLNSLSCNGQPYGVVSDGEGNLSGYAWSEKAGWINFNGVGATEYQVQIDSNGNLSGYAWSEKVGWINTDDIGENYGVTTVAGEGYCEDCVPCNSPVLAWNLDEGFGTTAYDSSFRGNNIYNNGTVAGGAVWQSQSECVSGKCLYFDGSNDNINRAYDSDLSFKSNSFSIGGWFKTSTVANPAYLFSRYDTAGWKVWLDADGDACFGIDDDNVWSGETPDDFICTVGKNYDDNNWHYVLAKKDATGGIYLYLDGQEEVSDLTLTATGPLSGTSPIFYAGVNSDGTTSLFGGFLDSIKIYDYARSADQIKQDYNEGAARIVSPRGTGAAIGRNSGTLLGEPILDLSFNEGQGSVAYDSSGNNNHGTLVSGTTGGNTTTTAMWDKDGKEGGAMEFDGVDDYIYIDKNIFNGLSGYTVSMWINRNPGVVNYLFSGSSGFPHMWDFGALSGIRFKSSGADPNYITTPLADSTWYNIVVSQNGNSATWYVNGKKNKEPEASSLATYNTGVYFGSNFDASSFWGGKIDEVKIYNYALSEDEIKTLYNDSSAMVMGSDASRNNNGIEVTGANKDYCIPGDTAKCDKPVLELKMDEMTGTTAKDSSGNGRDGTISGAVWDRGKINSGLKFDGDGDRISVDNGSDLATSTYCAWHYYAGEDMYGLVEGADTDANFDAYISGLDDVYFWADNTDGNRTMLTGGKIVENQWNQVCFVFGTGKREIYINGVKTAGDTFTAEPIRYNFIGETNSLSYFGSIDEVRIYDYARTPAQIAWDYNRGKPIGHWKMDESSGTQVDDWSGNAYHGTMTNMDPIGDRVEGKNNKALDFDGIDDYVGVGTAINNINAVSFWIKPTSTSQSILDLDGGTHNISISGGAVTATGFNTYYVDGQLNGTISDTNWHHITAISNTAFNSTTAFTIGKINTNYYSGNIDDVKIYNYIPTDEHIKLDYNNGAVNFR